METQITENKVKFQVSLSNGETVYEGKGNFKVIPGDKSPWLRLLRYIVDNGLNITSISLYTDAGQRFNFPTTSKRPKFAEFNDAEKPLDYNFFRKMASEADAVRDGNEVKIVSDFEMSDHYTCMEAIYSDYRLQLWVDEKNPMFSWIMLKRA